MVTREELEKMSPEEIAELQRKNCVFCKLIAGEFPSNKIFENETSISILDINPSTKGHSLVMPKDHVPILPLLPPDKFKQLFVDAKLISKGLKKSLLSKKITLFIANGAVAGQQASHFLFHLIPRDENDSLSNFNIIPDDSFLPAQKELFSSLKNNISLMMNNLNKQLGLTKQENPSSQDAQKSLEPKSVSKSSSSPEVLEEKRSLILKILDENKDARELLKSSPKDFKNLLDQNKDLKEIFSGVNLDVLSEKLKQIPESSFSNKTQSTPSSSKNTLSENKSENDLKSVEPIVGSSSNKQVSKIFLGDDPVAQHDALVDYFSKKPRARDLFINDLDTFKELLSKRPDVAKLFENVNIDLFSEKLKEISKNDSKTSIGKGGGSD